MLEENKQKAEQPDGEKTKLEQEIVEQEQEITALRKSESDLQEQLAVVSKSLTAAVAGYKNRVMQLHPGVTEELISGETIEAVDKSLEKALGIIGKVKKSVEKEIAQARVPAGAPGRQATDLTGLSAREKIQYALGGKK